MEIYTDGSLGNSQTSGLGWLLITDKGPVAGFTHHRVGVAQATIQPVELQAIKAAIKHALNLGHTMDGAVIYTDSLDSIELIRAEARGHRRGRPPTASAINRDLTRWITREQRISGLHFRHVRGHRNTPGNVAADRLAVMARRNREYGLDRRHGTTMAENITADYLSAALPAAGNHWPSPAAISLHRASGEPLCDACTSELHSLEKEAS
jgi:ribonuclease HI